MAQKVLFELVDDLDGRAADETVTFGLDGKTYEIDLTARNATKLRRSLDAYVKVGRRVRSDRSAPPKPANGSTRQVREWAKAHGFEVSDKGKIPQRVREAYEAAL